jgi:hypothetical protein
MFAAPLGEKISRWDLLDCIKLLVFFSDCWNTNTNWFLDRFYIILVV